MFGINDGTFAVVLIGLYMTALVVHTALDWIGTERQRQRLAKAIAAQHVVDSKEDAAREYEAAARRSMQAAASEAPMQLDTYELKHPWFSQASRWEASRRKTGPN